MQLSEPYMDSSKIIMNKKKAFALLSREPARQYSMPLSHLRRTNG